MTTISKTVLELTDQVEAAIAAGDWQLANELETKRLAELERLVLAYANPAERLPLMTTAQGRTRELIGLVEHHRRRVLREATTVRTGHAAAVRYIETQGGEAKAG
jgi:hypothetical protein